jgi:O-antigen ligase
MEPTNIWSGPVQQSRILLASVCGAIAFESLFFWAHIWNAYTVPKVVAALLGAAVLLPQVCIQLLEHPPSRFSRRLLLLFACQMGAITVATANSFSPAVSFWGGDWRRMGWITQFAMTSVAASIPFAVGANPKNFKFLLRVIAATGLLSAAYGMLQWLGWDPFLPAFLRGEIVEQFAGSYRSAGTIGQPTYFANYLLYPFFSSLALLTCETGWMMRAMTVLNMTLIAAVLTVATARGGLIGCTVGLAAFLGWRLTLKAYSRRDLVKPAGLVIAVATLVAAAGFAMKNNLPSVEPAVARLRGLGTDPSSEGRIILWRDVIERIAPKTWVAGAGPGMFRVAFTRYRSNDYSAFNPDVHWETAHNVFLDRLTEQGVLGLLAFASLIIAFAYNMMKILRSSPNPKTQSIYAAVGAALPAVLTSNCFNGEVIPTTYYFYVWIALSFAARDCSGPALPLDSPSKRRSRELQTVVIVAGIAASIGLASYAYRNWAAEISLLAAAQAVDSRDEQTLLLSADNVERAMRHVGTYHLEVAELTVAFLRENWNTLDEQSRTRLTQRGIASALWAVERTDKPMLALVDLVTLASMTADPRTMKWLQQLQELDPYWYRGHELSARLLLREGKLSAALREATIARQLAPYVNSTANLWSQLIAFRKEVGPNAR